MSDLYETTNFTTFITQIKTDWYEANGLTSDTNTTVETDVGNAVDSVVGTVDGFGWKDRDSDYRAGGGTIEYAITGNTATMKWRPSSTPLAYVEMYLLEWTPPEYVQSELAIDGVITCTSHWRQTTTTSTTSPVDPNDLIADLATPWIANIAYPEAAEESSVFSSSTVSGEDDNATTEIQPNDGLAPLGVHSDRPSIIYSARTTVDTDDGTPDVFDTNRAIYVVEMQNCLEKFLEIDEDMRIQLGIEWSTMRENLQRFITFNANISETRESLRADSAAIKDAAGFGEGSDFASVEGNGNEIFANVVATINYMSTRYVHQTPGSPFVSPITRYEGKIGSQSTGLPSTTKAKPWSYALQFAEYFMEAMSEGDGGMINSMISDNKTPGDGPLQGRWRTTYDDTWSPDHTNSTWQSALSSHSNLLFAAGYDMNSDSDIAYLNNSAHTLWQLTLKMIDPKFCDDNGHCSQLLDSETVGILDDFIGDDLASRESDLFNFESASSLSQIMNFKSSGGVNTAALEVTEASTQTENYSSGFKEWFIKPIAASLEGEEFDSSDFDTWKEQFETAMNDLKIGAHTYLAGGGVMLIANNVFRSILDMADDDMRADPTVDDPGPLGCQLAVSPDNTRNSPKVWLGGTSDYFGDPDATYEDYRFINFQFMMHLLGKIAEQSGDNLSSSVMSTGASSSGFSYGSAVYGSASFWQFLALECGNTFGNAFAFVPHFEDWYLNWVDSRTHYCEVALLGSGNDEYPAGHNPLCLAFDSQHWQQGGYNETNPSQTWIASGDTGLRIQGSPKRFLWAMPWDWQSHGDEYFIDFGSGTSYRYANWLPQYIGRTRVFFEGLDNGDTWNPEEGTDHGVHQTRPEVDEEGVFDSILLRYGGKNWDRTNQFWQVCDIVSDGEYNRVLGIPEHSTGLVSLASGTPQEWDKATTNTKIKEKLGDLFYGPPFWVKNLQPLCDFFEHFWDIDGGDRTNSIKRMILDELPDDWASNRGSATTGSPYTYFEQLCNLHWRTNFALPKHFVFFRQFMTGILDRFILKNFVCAQTMMQENGETPVIEITTIQELKDHLENSLGEDDGVKAYLAYRALASKVFSSFVRKHWKSLTSYHEDWKLAHTTYGNLAFNGPVELLDYTRTASGDRAFITGWDPHVHAEIGTGAFARGESYAPHLTATNSFANGIFTIGAGYAAAFAEDYVKAQQLFKNVISLSHGNIDDFATDVIDVKDYLPDALEKDSSRHGDTAAIDLYDWEDGAIVEGVMALLDNVIDPGPLQNEVAALVSMSNLLTTDLETGSTTAVRGAAGELMQDVQGSMQCGYVITQYLDNVTAFYENFLSLRDQAIEMAVEYVDLFELPGIDAQQMVNFGNSYQRNLVALQQDQGDTSETTGYIPPRHTRVGSDALGAVVKNIITTIANRGNPNSQAKDTVFYGIGIPTNSVPDWIQHDSLSPIIGISREHYSFVVPSFVSTLNLMFYDMNLFLDPAGLITIADSSEADDGTISYSVPDDPSEWIASAGYIYIQNGSIERLSKAGAKTRLVEHLENTSSHWWVFFYTPEATSNDTEEQGGTSRNKWHSLYEYNSSLTDIPVDVDVADLSIDYDQSEVASALADQILLNHIISTCFEYYYKIFAGLEVNEQCFPTDSESVLNIMINDYAKDEVLSDLGGADDNGIPDFESEIFMSDAINTKGTIVRAISPKIFDRVFHVPCVMDDLWFYSPKTLDAIDSDYTSLSYSDVEAIATVKGLEAHDDWELSGNPILWRYPEIEDESTTDDLNNNLSGGMDFAILYSKLDRG